MNSLLKKNPVDILVLVLWLLAATGGGNAIAAPGDITTIAGGGVGDTGPATSASLNLPRGIHITASGDMYIADTGNHRIRKMGSNGTISTVAGDGSAGYSGDGGPAASASLNYPLAVAVDNAGNILIADAHNHRVRKVNASGVITTIIGGGTENVAQYCSLFAGDAGDIFPRDVYLDSSGRMLVNDGQLWRLESDGTLINLSDPGCGYGIMEPGFSGGFFEPAGAFIYASGSSIFRTMDMQGGTLLGVLPVSTGSFTALSEDASGNIYVAVPESNIVYKLDPSGNVTPYAGTGVAGYSGDGAGAFVANLNNPTDVVVDASGYLYIADRMNHRIRKVDPNQTITAVAGSGEPGYAGEGLSAASEKLNVPRGVFADLLGNVYIADTYNHRVRKVDTSGVMTNIAGSGSADFSGDGGPATAASLSYPNGVFVNADGTIYIADSFNDRIRKIDASGTITTIAGTDDTGYAGDGGPATEAVLNYPTGVIQDASGNLFIADFGNDAIRKIDTSGTISTYANIYNPRSLAVDSSGVLYIATTYDGVNRVFPDGTVDVMPSCFDAVGISVVEIGLPDAYVACQNSHMVTKVTLVAAPQVIAGTGIAGFSGDEGPATAAKLALPSGVFVDTGGAIYIADSGNNRVRRIAGGPGPWAAIQSPASGSVNTATPRLWYATSAGTVAVKVDGMAVNKVSGDYLDPLADGSHIVRVEATNEYGTAYAERAFTVDTVIPVVTITSPAPGTIGENRPLLTYTVSEGTVTVTVDGVVVNTVSGNRLAALSDGAHTVRVESRDSAGNIGFAEVTFTVVAPPMVAISSPVAGSTNINTPLLTYTASGGAIVVNVDGVPVNKVSGDHLDPLGDGPHTVRVEATNANGTGFAECTFTVDTIAPTVAITSPADGITADNQPLLTYTVSDGTVIVTVDGVVANKVSGDRLFVLSNGLHAVRVESVDAAGNIGFGEVYFTVNAPIERVTEDFETGDFGKLPWMTGGNGLWAVQSAVRHAGMYAAEAPVSIGDSQSASLEVTRTTAADTISFWYSVSSERNYDYLKFYVDDVLKGQWSGTVSWTNASYAVSAGTHTFKWVYAKDSSVSSGSDTAWIDDIVLPLPPAPPTATITSPSAATTNNSTPVLFYSVSGGTVVVKVDGIAVNKISGDYLDPLADGPHTVRVEATDVNGTGYAEVSLTIDTVQPAVTISSPAAGLTNNNTPVLSYAVSDGTIVVQVDGTVVNKVSGDTLDSLADGPHTVRVEATDTAGNSGFAEVSFTVDTVPPALGIDPVTTPTKVSSQTVSGTREDNAAISVSVNTTASLGPVSYPTATSWSCTISNMVEGNNILTVTTTDEAGNNLPVPVIIALDTTAPVVTITSPVAGTGSNTTPLLSYTVSDGSVAVQVDGIAVNKASGDMLDSLADGPHTVRVEATDPAGNVGSAEAGFTVDTVAPAVTITSPAAGLTKNNAPTLIFTVSDGTAAVKVDGVVVAKVSGSALDPLSEGAHTVRVEATDTAGNTGFASVTFTVDTVPPAVAVDPVVTPTNVSSQTVTGTREENAAITVGVNTSATVGAVSYPTSTTWSCTISVFAPGPNAITITATDAAGNSAVASASITYDTIAPAVTITSPAGSPTNDNTPLLSYTVSDGTVVVKVDGTAVSKVSGQSLDALSNGSHTVRVESTDAAGNTGFASVTFTVDTVPPTITIKPVTSPTRSTSQTISGTRESGATVSVTVNTAATPGPVSYPASTTWKCTITGLVYGTNTITATAADSAGNTATATASIYERTH